MLRRGRRKRTFEGFLFFPVGNIGPDCNSYDLFCKPPRLRGKQRQRVTRQESFTAEEEEVVNAD